MVTEGLMKWKNTDENRRLSMGRTLCVRLGVCSVGSSLGYNLASGTALHCLPRESAESTDPGAQPCIHADKHTHTCIHKQQSPEQKLGIIIAIRSPTETMCPNHGRIQRCYFWPHLLVPINPPSCISERKKGELSGDM